jgi:hypothetical protein
MPKDTKELLEVRVSGLRRAMHPLTHRRKGSAILSFSTEYDVQDLLHALLRPSVRDIRPEEFTPSYAGSRTRMAFLRPNYGLVVETKIVRDRGHAKKIGDELILVRTQPDEAHGAERTQIHSPLGQVSIAPVLMHCASAAISVSCASASCDSGER